MQQLGLKSPVRLKKYRSYRGNMGLAAENILQRQFKAEAPCEKWVTDITEFRAGGQKLYLSPILDLFNGEIVAWETACRPTEELVKRMLNKGLESLAEGEKPLLHSDQGWHYRIKSYQSDLADKGLVQSMSRKGNCLDNAVMENFFGHLKEEIYYRRDYRRVQHEPSDRKQSDERLKLEIKVAHIRTRETYGTRRLQTELAENGIIVGRDRLARLRKELRLRCKQKRKFRATTNSNHNLPVAPNLLNQTFAPTAPNQVWVADLTYVATQEGWLYLAGIKDVYTCEIVGYAMGERMTKELTGKALFMALRSQRPPAGLIHHSDRGSQYCAYDYRVIQEQFGLKTSMSRKGNCYDNAPMESFWGTLKNESLSHYRFNNRDEAITVIREYIEIFYNRQRRHSRLGNISPAAFREKYHQMTA